MVLSNDSSGSGFFRTRLDHQATRANSSPAYASGRPWTAGQWLQAQGGLHHSLLIGERQSWLMKACRGQYRDHTHLGPEMNYVGANILLSE